MFSELCLVAINQGGRRVVEERGCFTEGGRVITSFFSTPTTNGCLCGHRVLKVSDGTFEVKSLSPLCVAHLHELDKNLNSNTISTISSVQPQTKPNCIIL